MTSPREIRCDVQSVELLRRLVELPLPLRLGSPRALKCFLRDVYLDTPDGRLRQYGITCRYRARGDDRHRLTLLIPAPDAPAGKARERHEADLDEADALRAVQGESAPARRLQAIVDPTTLIVAFTVQTERFTRRSSRGWLRLAQFDFAYDIVSVEQNGIARHFQELRVRRRHPGPPSLARVASALAEEHGLRPILVSRMERERLVAAGVGREAERRAVGTGHAVALVAMDRGSIACRNEGGVLRLPIAQGSGDGACRHLLRECFGSAVGELRLLADLPANEERPHLEVWLALQTRQRRQTEVAETMLWLSLEELIARAGTRSLSDPQTLAALLIVARSDLATIGRTSKPVPAVSHASKSTPRGPEEDEGSWSISAEERLLDGDFSLLEFNARVLALAEDVQTPLLERLQYLAIVSANTDEFFAVRMTALKRIRIEITGEQRIARAEERLVALGQRVRSLHARQQQCLRECTKELALHGVHLVPFAELNLGERATLHRYFRDVVFPALTPQAVTEAPGYPRPRVASFALSLAVLVMYPLTGPVHLA